MGIDWVGGKQLNEAIPPAYTTSSAPNCSPTSKEPPVSSYASDLRAAAEAEREAGRQDDSPGTSTSYVAASTLTIPDRLLPFLTDVEQLERVAEAAKPSHSISW